MFSNLGPLFKATFRQTEQADTRMAIRKDDPRDPHKRPDSDDRDDGDDELWEDSTGVSVGALLAFLRDFVAGRTAAATGREAGQSADSPVESGQVDGAAAPPSERTPIDPRAAEAARAYRSQARAAGGGLPASLPPVEPQSDVDLVQAQDVRVIHALIADLDALAGAGVDILVLEKAGSFLQSLQDAVHKAKSNI